MHTIQQTLAVLQILSRLLKKNLKNKFVDLIFSLTFAAAMIITNANTGFFYFSYYFRNSPGCLC